MISFACPHCSKNYTVPDHQAGIRAKCRQCRESLVVPAAPPPAAWKTDVDTSSAGTAERAKTPTDAEFVLPPVSAGSASPPAPSNYVLKAERENGKGPVFVVELEFADDPGPETVETAELYDEARQFLADVLYAYRHRLAPDGVKLMKIRVDGFEREI